MKRLVIDIETVGSLWEEHDPYVREYLIKGLNEAEAEEEKRRGGLSPFRGKIVAIGVINADDGRSCVLYEVPDQNELATTKDGLRTFISGNEKLILEKFWEFLGKNDRFISFNGRQFDGPFLMIRSAVHGIAPKRDLVGYRYAFHPNCDLREVLNFQGTLSRQAKFNLDFACKAFGITSSKTEGLDGRAVETLYRAGKYDDIAAYCLEDVRATCELYWKLATTLLVWDRAFRQAEEANPPKPRELTLVPASDQSFMDAINEGSARLSAALEGEEGRTSDSILEKQPAAILEKLASVRREDEELAAELDSPLDRS